MDIRQISGTEWDNLKMKVGKNSSVTRYEQEKQFRDLWKRTML